MSTNNFFPAYQLNHPLHLPPSSHQFDQKLTQLKHKILSILNHEQPRITTNISRSQRLTLKDLKKNKDLVYLPSDKS